MGLVTHGTFPKPSRGADTSHAVFSMCSQVLSQIQSKLPSYFPVGYAQLGHQQRPALLTAPKHMLGLKQGAQARALGFRAILVYK